MPLTRKQAKQKLQSISMAKKYRERAEELIDDPDDLNQGDFGVCGMTSVVYSLLHYDLGKFIDLLASIFSGAPFSQKYWSPIEIPLTVDRRTVLLKGRLKQLREKDDREGIDRDYDLDFILSRALGKLLKMTNPSLYAAQIRFSNRLVANFSERDPDERDSLAAEGYQKEGDLGLDRDGMTWILTYLAGAQEVSTIVNEERWAVELVNRTFAKGYRNPFVYGCILDASRFITAVGQQERGEQLTVFDSFTPPTHDAEAEHIVVVTDPITEAGTNYVVSIWTWQKRLTIEVDKGLLKRFFPTFVFGYFG